MTSQLEKHRASCTVSGVLGLDPCTSHSGLSGLSVCLLSSTAIGRQMFGDMNRWRPDLNNVDLACISATNEGTGEVLPVMSTARAPTPA